MPFPLNMPHSTWPANVSTIGLPPVISPRRCHGDFSSLIPRDSPVVIVATCVDDLLRPCFSIFVVFAVHLRKHLSVLFWSGFGHFHLTHTIPSQL